MGFLNLIRQHAAVSSGDFGTMFKDITIPTLPAIATRLLAEFDSPEPDLARLSRIVSADVDVSARVLRTVNSSLFNLPAPVKGLQHAITMMGLNSLYTLALSYSVRGAIPEPDGELFDRQAFWSDSLLRSLVARELSSRLRVGNEDEAFTAMLMSDISIPMLLSTWESYYGSVVERWADYPGRLSDLEQEEFGWDHSMASAWILESWAFPEELVALVEAHNLSPEDIRRLGLESTIALPLVLASQMPSVIHCTPGRIDTFIRQIIDYTQTDLPGLADLLRSVENNFAEIHREFDLPDGRRPESLYLLFDEIADLSAEALS